MLTPSVEELALKEAAYFVARLAQEYSGFTLKDEKSRMDSYTLVVCPKNTCVSFLATEGREKIAM